MNLFEICNRTTPHLVGFKHLEHLFEALSVKCKPETQSPIKIFVFLKPFFFAKLVKSVRWFEILLLLALASSSRDNLKYNAVPFYYTYSALWVFFHASVTYKTKLRATNFQIRKYFGRNVSCAATHREQQKTMLTILLYYICLTRPISPAIFSLTRAKKF